MVHMLEWATSLRRVTNKYWSLKFFKLFEYSSNILVYFLRDIRLWPCVESAKMRLDLKRCNKRAVWSAHNSYIHINTIRHLFNPSLLDTTTNERNKWISTPTSKWLKERQNLLRRIHICEGEWNTIYIYYPSSCLIQEESPHNLHMVPLSWRGGLNHPRQ